MTLKVVHESTRSSVYVKESFKSANSETEEDYPHEDVERYTERSATDSLLQRRNSNEHFKKVLEERIDDISKSLEQEEAINSSSRNNLTVS